MPVGFGDLNALCPDSECCPDPCASILGNGFIEYLLIDCFKVNQAAGAVQGTFSEPGPGLRDVVTDTENKISIVGGELLIASGKIVPAWGDPTIWWTKTNGDAFERVAGRTLAININSSDYVNSALGFDDEQLTNMDDSRYTFSGDALYFVYSGVFGTYVISPTDGIEFDLYTMLRDMGAYYFVANGGFGSSPLLIGVTNSHVGQSLYPSINNHSSINVVSKGISVADQPLITPTASDTFDSVVALDAGDNEVDGVHVRVGLDGDAGHYSPDGLTYTQLDAADLDTAGWDGDVGSFVAHVKPAQSSGTYRAVGVGRDSGDFISLYQSSANAVAVRTVGGASLSSTFTHAGLGVAQVWGANWDRDTDDELTVLVNGSPDLTPATSLPAWIDTPLELYSVIGALTNANVQNFDGEIYDVIISLGVEISNANHANISTKLLAGTLTANDLDTYIGSGAWIWYKQNEHHVTNGGTETVKTTDASSNALVGYHHRVALNGSYGKYNLISNTNIYSIALNTFFDGQEGGVIQRLRASDFEAWSGAETRRPLYLNVDGANRIGLQSTVSPNAFNFFYIAGGTTEQTTKSSVSTLDWFTPAMIWSKTNNNFQAYWNGATEGAAQAIAGTWAGALLSTECNIGATNTDALNSYHGDIGDTIIFNSFNGDYANIDTHIATIHTLLDAGTLTTSHLDTIFGAGNWVWFQNNEANAGGSGLTWTGDKAGTDDAKLYIAAPPGTELLANNDFSAWTADDPDGWTVGGEVGADPEVTERDSGQLNAGTNLVGGSANIYSSATTFNPSITQTGLTVGDFYKQVIVASAYGSGSLEAGDQSGTALVTINGVGTFQNTFAAANAIYRVRVAATVPTDATMDSVSVKPLTLSELITSVDTSHSEAIVSAGLTTTDDTQHGLVLNLDSATSPANLVLVYCDRVDNKIYLKKLVAGVWTTVGSVAFTYGAGQKLECWKSGTSYRVRYNDVHLLAGTISDAGIVDNTRHGVFSTDSDSYAENFLTHQVDGHDNLDGMIACNQVPVALNPFLQYNESVFWDFQEPVEDTSGVAKANNQALATGRSVSSKVFTDYTAPPAITDAGGNVARWDGTAGLQNLSDSVAVIPNLTWEFTYTISNYSAGSMRARVGNIFGTVRSGDGTYTEEITADAANLILLAGNGFAGDVDLTTMTVKQTNILASSAYPGAEEVTNGGFATGDLTGWANNGAPPTREVTGGRLHVISDAGSQGVNQSPTGSVAAGKRYQTSIDYEVTGANLRYDDGGVGGFSKNYGNATATDSFEFTAGGPNIRVISTAAAVEFFADNISIKEANPFNADHTGVLVGEPGTIQIARSCYYDGVADFTDGYSAELNGYYNPNEGTFILFGKADTGVWVDGVFRYLARFQAAAGNQIYVTKSAGPPNINVNYEGGAVLKAVAIPSGSPTDFFMLGMTWKNNVLRGFWNGIQSGADVPGLVDIVGNLDPNICLLGAFSQTPTNTWHGWLSYPIISNRALSDQAILDIYNLGI
jgi:hypothetical protein